METNNAKQHDNDNGYINEESLNRKSYERTTAG